MPEQLHPLAPSEPGQVPPLPGEEQPGLVREGDVLPVLAPVPGPALSQRRGLPRARRSSPAVQAAAVAAGGFVAGAAVAGLVHRRQRQSALARGGLTRTLGRAGSRRAAKAAAERLQVISSQTLLVDVHVLGPADLGS